MFLSFKIYPYLYAFKRGHECQTTLLRREEDWRTLLDNNQYIAAVLMDLSKTFDSLPFVNSAL